MNLVNRSPRNPNSHLTVKERTSPSFPVKHLLMNKQIHGRVLDFGCGEGMDLTYLQSNGFDAVGFDPHYKPVVPAGKFDTILCTYVLNVLLPEEQSQVLMAVSELLKPGGKAFFTVRRDIIKSGFRTHLKHQVEVFQCNVILPYKSILKTDSCEIYEYRHINQLEKHSKVTCPYCSPDPLDELITESASAYAIIAPAVQSPGQILIIPKKHQADFFALTEREKTACLIVMDRAKLIIDDRFQPIGYKVEINIGEGAGQTCQHSIINLMLKK